MLKGHRDTADYLKAKGALPYSDLTNVQKTERRKSDVKQETAVKQTEDQSLQRKSPEDQKTLKGKGDKGKGDKGKAADETDAKAKDDAAKAAAAAAAALAAKEAAEKEKAKKAEAEKEKKKTDERKSPEQRKSPEHTVEKKEVGVGIETATVGIVTDDAKEEGGEGSTQTKTDQKEQEKKQKKDARASPSSLKTERSIKSIKSQTVPIYVRNKKTGTGMGAQPTKKKKVVEETKREEAVSPDSKGKEKKNAKFDKLTDDYDSGNETDPGRSRRKKNKYAPHGPNFVDEIHESVRRYQNNRNKSRQLHQFKRAQIHTGPMHDIVMFSKMMDNYRKGHEKGDEDDLDLRAHTSWDGYLQGEKQSTVKILNIWTPQKFAVITLKFDQNGFTKE